MADAANGNDIATGTIPQRLVEAAIVLLATEGPSAIKARTVAAKAGMSSMVVYNYFGGVPELVNAVVDHGFHQLDDGFARIPVTEDPLADLFAMALTTLKYARANPHLYDAMFGLSTRATYRPASEKDVRTMNPDLAMLATVPVRGVIVTSVATTAGFDFVSRFFAPASGVN